MSNTKLTEQQNLKIMETLCRIAIMRAGDRPGEHAKIGVILDEAHKALVCEFEKLNDRRPPVDE